MAEERTEQALPIEEINQLTKTLVDTMADGTPKEIAKGLESQFVDRSTEHLYRKVTPTDQSESTEVYKYVKGEIESAFIPTRRDMKLSFLPTCYSSNDPITLLYESNYKLIQFWTLAILENDDVMGAFLDGMLQAGVDGSNGITMTVYVDDVTFSSENRISKNFRDKIIAIIRKYNYQISRKKVKRYTKFYPKLVTGVIIDTTGNPVLKNSMRQKIMLAYNDLKTNPENADLRMRLRGLLIAARQVNEDAFPTIYKFAFQPNESIEY